MDFVEKCAYAVRYVQGKKTYFAILACGITEVVYAFGYINGPSRDALLQLFGGAGALAFCAKINRAVDALKVANNASLRGK